MMTESFMRVLPRYAVLLIAASLLFASGEAVGRAFDPVLAGLMFSFSVVIIGVVGADALLRVLQPRLDAQDAAQAAMAQGSVAAALVYFARCVLLAAIMMIMIGSVRAQTPKDMPKAALSLLPILAQEQKAFWPDMARPEILAGQIEQETCISMTHRMCWSPRAELRTKRERGVGLGQMTIAFNPDGSTRFDALSELAAVERSLAGLSWAQPYDARLQMRYLVIKDRKLSKQFATDSEPDATAFMLAAYNGGAGGVMSDKKVCAATKGCNPSRWHGHVEHTSRKARKPHHGYGKSFFQINREYPVLIEKRAKKYVEFLRA